jgi:hypothetical protein
MKTRKRIQIAFFTPDSSWSRKRSPMIVIRIQIQITKKKIARVVTRASVRPYVASVIASFRRLLDVRVSLQVPQSVRYLEEIRDYQVFTFVFP